MHKLVNCFNCLYKKLIIKLYKWLVITYTHNINNINMGSFLSTLFPQYFETKKMKILMLGLDGAGKSAILNKLHLGETVTTVPTIGFNVETITYKNISFIVWDVGGQEKIRPLWRHYYADTDALIFVIDSNDIDRIPIAKNELMLTMNDPRSH